MTTLSPPSGENMKGIYILWGLFILEMYKHTDTLDHQCSQIVLQDRLRTFSNLFVSSLLTEIMFGQGTVCLSDTSVRRTLMVNLLLSFPCVVLTKNSPTHIQGQQQRQMLCWLRRVYKLNINVRTG